MILEMLTAEPIDIGGWVENKEKWSQTSDHFSPDVLLGVAIAAGNAHFVNSWIPKVYLHTGRAMLFSWTIIFSAFPGGSLGITNHNLRLTLSNESLDGISFGRFKES